MKKRKKDFFNSIYLWWKFEGRHIPRDIKIGIKNLISWFPIIWKDRPWDYHYIYTILEEKLKRTSEHINSAKIFEGYEYVVRDINIAIKLIERLKTDYYSSEYFDYIESEFNFIPVENNPNLKTLEVKTIKENLSDFFLKYPRIYKKYRMEKNKKLVAMKISQENHNRAKKLLFKILEEKIEHWWD